MALDRSDNERTNHPKPEFEHYRKFNSGDGTYVDWASTSEVTSNTNATFRKQKRFRIAGADFICESDGATFTPVATGGGGGGGILVSPLQASTDGGEAYLTLSGIGAYTALNSTLVMQGMRPLERVAEVATPVSGQYRIDTVNNRIYFGDPLGPLEQIIVVR